MSVAAILRFAPAWTPKVLDEPRLIRELMVERGALAQVRLDEKIPVLVNHDHSRVIGHVREILVREDVITGTDVALWHFAHVELDDPPVWLERNITGVSWAHNDLWSWEPPGLGTKVLRQGLIHEISILSPSTKPLEPLARVVWFEKASSPAAVLTSDRAVAGDPLKPQRIVRRGIGEVLGVR